MPTYALPQDDTWSRDNECWGDGDEMQSACKKLAASWKKLLEENAAADLGGRGIHRARGARDAGGLPGDVERRQLGLRGISVRRARVDEEGTRCTT